jgi:fatty-acid desaturase
MELELRPVEATLRGRASLGLPYPAGTVESGIRWHYAAGIALYHLLALLAFNPWFFSWTGLAIAIIGVPVFGSIGINLCYHRLLSHRSFCTPLWLEHTFAILGVCCLEDTPARWVAVHRRHHHRVDEERDPHTPLVNLFWAYLGWLLVENKELSGLGIYDRYARDIIRDRFYVAVERYYIFILLLSWIAFFAVGFLAAIALGGTLSEAVQFGASLWLWGAVLRTIAVWHITWSGNSFSHLWGYRNYQTNDNSRNNFILAIINNGEGWHNNHHADPQSANNGHYWWEFDATFLFLRLLAAMGLAWNIVLPSRRVTSSSEFD